MNNLDETVITEEDFAHLARLAIAGQQDDVRLFVARTIRKHRAENPEFADKLDHFLRDKRYARSSSPLRREPTVPTNLPIDRDTRLELLRQFKDQASVVRPLLNKKKQFVFDQLIRERRQADRLAELGLHPTRSAIFLGPPGIGKTLTARWLAAQLNLPLLVLDLTTVMSSFLGRTGANIRSVLEYAKQTPTVLLLDEFDAIAKRRSDDSDIGELKRLVTVMLQEIENWPPTGLLLAATNHPELIDNAIWRRFDLVVEFQLPEAEQVREAVLRFASNDDPCFGRWLDVLSCAFNGASFSDIERELYRMRRTLALGGTEMEELVEELVRSRMLKLTKEERISFAALLKVKTKFSQRTISELTGLARDTLRKRQAQTNVKEA
jgi:SpoVK/Ycf46/Vps4 family AAA+-type ATPase